MNLLSAISVATGSATAYHCCYNCLMLCSFSDLRLIISKNVPCGIFYLLETRKQNSKHLDSQRSNLVTDEKRRIENKALSLPTLIIGGCPFSPIVMDVFLISALTILALVPWGTGTEMYSSLSV